MDSKILQLKEFLRVTHQTINLNSISSRHRQLFFEIYDLLIVFLKEPIIYFNYLMKESGTTVGKYELLDHLGQGSFAIVYKGRNLETKEIVAIKKMTKMTKKDADMVKKEISIMKELDHKNIVRYIDDFRDKGEWYIVLEYCGKGDLDHFKQKVGKIPEQHCKMFIEGILEALVELHKKKIAHRDLKLANILITDDYKLKLADFGFSKDYESGYMKTFCGSPITMAPEILKRETYNEKCDVWSLGVITYMLLYRIPPFLPTKAEGMGIQGITIAITQRTHKFIDSVPVSEECKKFINDCLKKNSKDRPTTAQLLSHEWFEGLYQNQVSKLRQKAIKDSLQDETDMFEKEAVRLCDIMLFGVFEEHLKKIGQTMLLNSEVIKRTTTIFEKYYAGDRKFLEYYFMLILKKLDSLEQREVIYMIYDQSFKIKVKDMEKYQEFQREVFSLVKNEMPDLNAGKFEKVNFEREIIKFCISETELLMDSSKDEEITEKMYLLKNWCKFATVEYENTMIEIQWGERKDYEKYQEYVAKYLIGVNEEVISRTINQQPQSDQDLEATWLIENHIKESNNKKSLDVELGKLALYVLNIPSNFSVDKTIQTEKIMLAEEDYWYQQVI